MAASELHPKPGRLAGVFASACAAEISGKSRQAKKRKAVFFFIKHDFVSFIEDAGKVKILQGTGVKNTSLQTQNDKKGNDRTKTKCRFKTSVFDDFFEKPVAANLTMQEVNASRPIACIYFYLLFPVLKKLIF